MGRGDLAGAIEPVAGGGAPLLAWLDANVELARDRLRRDGALILRGFDAADDETAGLVLERLGGSLLDDAFWSTPRSGVAGKTFTATELVATRSIALHSEMAYMPAWPRLVAFHSLQVAEEGGATTVCNLDDASAALAPLLARFADTGVRYRRYYHTGIDIPWSKAFRTQDRDEVAAIAASAGMAIEWLPGNVLMTEHAAQGTVADGAGGTLWFNQVHLFHPASLAPAARSQLAQLLGADKLPRQSFYGDGAPIEDATIAAVNDAFDTLTHDMNWQAGDVLVLDNMRFAHGRAPFKGARRLHVALADQHTAPRRTPLFA